ELGERALPTLRVPRHDHLAHCLEAAALEEHVFRAAEPDALGAEVAAAVRIGWRIGIAADPQVPDLVGPAQQAGEVAAQLRILERGAAGVDPSGGAVHRDPFAGGELAAVHADVAQLF